MRGAGIEAAGVCGYGYPNLETDRPGRQRVFEIGTGSTQTRTPPRGSLAVGVRGFSPTLGGGVDAFRRARGRVGPARPAGRRAPRARGDGAPSRRRGEAFRRSR